MHIRRSNFHDIAAVALVLAALAIPVALQRKCERLGYWTAEDLAAAIERGKFPWIELEYDERMQIQRAAEKVLAPIAMPVHKAGDTLGKEFTERDVGQRPEMDV